MCIWPQESSCATSQNAQDFPLRLVILKCIIPLIILILCHFTISFYHLFLKLLVQELFYSFNFCFLQLCLRSSPLPAVWVRSCPWTRPTSHIFILHGQQITEDDLRLNRPPYRREREKKNSPRQNITVNSLTLQGRPKKQISFVGARWLLAAVGNAAHAFVFMHIATNMVLGLRERVGEWIREEEKSVSVRGRNRERITDDESVTKGDGC